MQDEDYKKIKALIFNKTLREKLNINEEQLKKLLRDYHNKYFDKKDEYNIFMTVGNLYSKNRNRIV